VSVPKGPKLRLDVSTLQRSLLHLDLSDQQKPALLLDSWSMPKDHKLHLDVSKLQRQRLHLDFSGQEKPVLVLDESTTQGPELHLDVSTVHYTEAFTAQ
jgi:hypothetical protein